MVTTQRLVVACLVCLGLTGASSVRAGDADREIVAEFGRIAVNAADAERPPAYTDTIVDAAGDVVARQVIVGDRRWILVGQDWVAAEPIPFLTPAAWGEAYVDATPSAHGPTCRMSFA